MENSERKKGGKKDGERVCSAQSPRIFCSLLIVPFPYFARLSLLSERLEQDSHYLNDWNRLPTIWTPGTGYPLVGSAAFKFRKQKREFAVMCCRRCCFCYWEENSEETYLTYNIAMCRLQSNCLVRGLVTFVAAVHFLRSLAAQWEQLQFWGWKACTLFIILKHAALKAINQGIQTKRSKIRILVDTERLATECVLFSGRGGTQQSLIGSAPRSKPLTLLYTIFDRNGTLSYIFHGKLYPFHVPSIENGMPFTL